MRCLRFSDAAEPSRFDQQRAAVLGALTGPAGQLQASPADPVLAAEELLVDLVERVCTSGPTALVVDDLQWADDATLRVWRRLYRMVDQLPPSSVSACCPDPARVALTELREQSRALVRSMSASDRCRLMRRSALPGGLLGAAPGPRLLEVTADAAGILSSSRRSLTRRVWRSGSNAPWSG